MRIQSKAGKYTVSTVDVPYMQIEGPFETMVFDLESSGYEDLDRAFYQTQAEAYSGHQAMLDKWVAKAEEEEGSK